MTKIACLIDSYTMKTFESLKFQTAKMMQVNACDISVGIAFPFSRRYLTFYSLVVTKDPAY